MFRRARWVGGGIGTGFFVDLRLDAPDAAILLRRLIAEVSIGQVRNYSVAEMVRTQHT